MDKTNWAVFDTGSRAGPRYWVGPIVGSDRSDVRIRGDERIQVAAMTERDVQGVMDRISGWTNYSSERGYVVARASDWFAAAYCPGYLPGAVLPPLIQRSQGVTSASLSSPDISQQSQTPTDEGVDYYGGAADPYEARKVILAWSSAWVANLGPKSVFPLGSVLKYLRRLGEKPGADIVKDCRKVIDYMTWIIDLVETQESDS